VYEPFRIPAKVSQGLWKPPIKNTVAIWFFATAPIWLFAADAALFIAFSSVFTLYMQLLFSVLIFVITLYLAFLDRRALLANGHQTAESLWWILLSPLVLLIARAVHVRRSVNGGIAPIFVWILSCAIVAGVIVTAYLLSPELLPFLRQFSAI
jgi:hypothetical protein